MLKGSGRQHDERCWRGIEVVNSTSNRVGGGGAERLLTTSATVLEEPGRLLTMGATGLRGGGGQRGC